MIPDVYVRGHEAINVRNICFRSELSLGFSCLKNIAFVTISLGPKTSGSDSNRFFLFFFFFKTVVPNLE